MAPGPGVAPRLALVLACLAAITGTSGLLPSFPNRVAARPCSRRGLVTCKGGELPTSVKVAISDMTGATQAALQSRCSRMDVELPPGVELGVEKGSKATSGLFNEGGDADAAIASVMRSDRELARLYVEMFSRWEREGRWGLNTTEPSGCPPSISTARSPHPVAAPLAGHRAPHPAPQYVPLQHPRRSDGGVLVDGRDGGRAGQVGKGHPAYGVGRWGGGKERRGEEEKEGLR